MHLSPLEHGVYRLLMDAYYATEKPIPLDFEAACRIARCVSKVEQEALGRVLTGFFTETGDGYRQKRIDAEIEAYQAKAQKNRENGKLGGRPANPNETQTVSERLAPGIAKANPNLTLTNNQEPITKKQRTKTRLPDGFAVSPQLREWAQEHGFSNLEGHLAYFRDWAKGSGTLKTDWDAAFRNAVRGNWAKLPAAGPKSADPPWKGAK
jgi:uncharacterized protein YdaU (DUF1376 family)